jgi:RNAse (barnase) inhibitor barstar
MSRPAFNKLLAECQKADGPAVVEAASLAPEEAGRLVTALGTREIQGRVLDGARLSGKADLLRALAIAFAFPSYFGDNWDALLDVLSDMSWLPAKGYAIVLLHADAFHAADATAHDTFVEVCEDAAERWAGDSEARVFKLVRAAKG